MAALYSPRRHETMVGFALWTAGSNGA